MPVDATAHGMGRRDLTEQSAEGDLLGGGDVLVAEEHDAPAQQGGADVGDGDPVERSGQVHAVDLGADERRRRPDVEAEHGVGGGHG